VVVRATRRQVQQQVTAVIGKIGLDNDRKSTKEEKFILLPCLQCAACKAAVGTIDLANNIVELSFVYVNFVVILI